MDKTMPNLVSVEKFAAYLDGNLSIEETQEVADLIMNDSTLSELLIVNSAIENQIQQMEENSIVLPDDLKIMDFSLPSLDETVVSPILNDIETLLPHEDYTIDNNDSLGINSDNSSFHHTSEDTDSSSGYESFFSPDNDSVVDTGMQLDFLNND